MAADNYVRSYGDVSVKEDVLSLVEILTATENSFLNRLSPNRAISTVHSTLTDTLRTPTTSRAVAEGVDATILAGTTPSRVTNVVETVAIPFVVSGIQEAIDHYHETNELTRQTVKALKEWGKKILPLLVAIPS